MKSVRLSDLDDDQIDEVVAFLQAAQIFDSQTYDEIKDFITGRSFGYGKYFLVNFANEKIVMTIGAVVAEITTGDIYITALSYLKEFESSIESSLNQLMKYIQQFKNCRIKFGIRESMAVPTYLPEKSGFVKIYSLVKMIYHGKLVSEHKLSEVRLEALSQQNLQQFVNTSNCSFKNIMNAAQIDEQDAQALLSIEDDCNMCGLIYHDKIIKGAFELKLFEKEGWIESICILPEFQGKKLGQLFMQKLILRLKKAGAEKILLTVIDANEKAFKLYQKMNFTTECKVSDWYEKKM